MELTILEANTAVATVREGVSGDEAAFARLIDEHREPMVRAAYVVAGDAQLAREAAQNAWAIAWKRLSSLREPVLVIDDDGQLDFEGLIFSGNVPPLPETLSTE
jgi:hypothetical protein